MSLSKLIIVIKRRQVDVGRLGGYDKSVQFYHNDWIGAHEWSTIFIKREAGHFNKLPFC